MLCARYAFLKGKIMKLFEKGKVFTIPNILSLVRLLLIPVIVYVYVVRQKPLTAALLLLASGATDTLDGIIARKFDMVSELGKALDPIADKLTQIAMVFCLATRFRGIRILLCVLLAKELFVGLTSLIACHKQGRVLAAEWHGKLATTVMYAVMLAHLFFPHMPETLSMAFSGVCIALVVLSGVLYGIRNISAIRTEKEPSYEAFFSDERTGKNELTRTTQNPRLASQLEENRKTLELMGMIAELKTKKDKLGLFKIKERKRLQEQIEQATAEMENIRNKTSD